MVHLVAPALCQSCIAGIAKRPHMHVRPWQCYVLHGPFGARTSGPRIRFPDRRDGPFFFVSTFTSSGITPRTVPIFLITTRPNEARVLGDYRAHPLRSAGVLPAAMPPTLRAAARETRWVSCADVVAVPLLQRASSSTFVEMFP